MRPASRINLARSSMVEASGSEGFVRIPDSLKSDDFPAKPCVRTLGMLALKRNMPAQGELSPVSLAVAPA